MSPPISLTLSFGACTPALRAAKPPRPNEGPRPGADGADAAERNEGWVGLSAMLSLLNAFAAASTEFAPACELRAAI